MATLPVLFADDSFIRNRLLTSGQLLQNYPILASFREQMLKVDKSCTTCSGKEQAIAKRDELLNTIRSTLATLSPEAKRDIRTALGASQIRCPYLVKDGNKRKLISGVI